MRYNAKTDQNQAEIVAALRTVGATVRPIHRLGGGLPDLLVGYRGQNYLFQTWRGQVAIVRNIAQALAAIDITKSNP